GRATGSRRGRRSARARPRASRPPAPRTPPPRRRTSSRIALELEPAAAAMDVHPAFAPDALRVVAHEQVLRPFLVGCPGGIGRILDLRLPAVGELDHVPFAAPGAADLQHQWRTPAAPCSSIRAPV